MDRGAPTGTAAENAVALHSGIQAPSPIPITTRRFRLMRCVTPLLGLLLLAGCGSPARSPTLTSGPSTSVATALPTKPVATARPTSTPRPVATNTSQPAPTAAPKAPPPTAPPTAMPTPQAATSAGSAPCEFGQVKGNRESRIYHAPGQRDYARTRQNVQCFDSEADARAAGYRRAER